MSFHSQAMDGPAMQPNPSKDWVSHLTGTLAQKDTALSELRELLALRMERAFRSNSRVDSAFVEDTVQDALLVILDSLHQFEGRSQFTTWATTITVRIAMAELRRQRWKNVSLDQLMDRTPVEAGDIEKPLLRDELIQEMRRMISEQLTEKQQTALTAELQGMPQEEIGRRMGSNRNAIYKLVHDARKRLKKAMTDAGYSVEDLTCLGRTNV